MEKLQVLSFIFIVLYKRCPFFQVLTGGVLYREFCCKFCPLSLTQLDVFVKSDYPRVF
ncbi:hypothetical protein Hanom_Chr10g00952971 [Helianthus anomalus]